MSGPTHKTSVVFVGDQHGTVCYKSWEAVPDAMAHRLFLWRLAPGVLTVSFESRGGRTLNASRAVMGNPAGEKRQWARRALDPGTRLLICLPAALALLLASLLLS